MNKKVIISIAVAALVALIFIFFKFSQKECIQPEILMLPEKPFQSQSVTFRCNNAAENENITWDFGDTTGTFKGAEVTHKFKAAGTFTIKSFRDENCFSTKEVTILPKRKVQMVTPTINFPSEIHANEPITFSDATTDATVWSWKIQESEDVSTEKSFSTIFKKPGKYTINLYLRGNGIKGDTSFVVDVLSGVSSTPPKNNVTPPAIVEKPKVEAKPEMKPEPKPKAEPIAKPEPKPKPEPIAKPEPKPKPEPAPKPEPKPKPEPIAKPEPKAKVEAAVPTFLSDADFTSSFINIANALANEDDNASNEWRDKIVPQTGTKGSMKVIIKDGAQMVEKTLESFKKTQLISSEPYKVADVKEIKRTTKNGPINQITVILGK